MQVDPFTSVSAAHHIGENVRLQIHESHPEVAEVFIHIGRYLYNCTWWIVLHNSHEYTIFAVTMWRTDICFCFGKSNWIKKLSFCFAAYVVNGDIDELCIWILVMALVIKFKCEELILLLLCFILPSLSMSLIFWLCCKVLSEGLKSWQK